VALDAAGAGVLPELQRGRRDVLGLGVDLADQGEVRGEVGGQQREKGQPQVCQVGFEVDDLAEVTVDEVRHRVSDPLRALLDDRLEQVCLVVEVVVDGAVGDAGFSGDRIQARPGVAVTGEQGERAADDRPALVGLPAWPVLRHDS
jgi:hypothetical protein